MRDKTFAIEEGAIHGGTECTACEETARARTAGAPGGDVAFGYYGDTFAYPHHGLHGGVDRQRLRY